MTTLFATRPIAFSEAKEYSVPRDMEASYLDAQWQDDGIDANLNFHDNPSPSTLFSDSTLPCGNDQSPLDDDQAPNGAVANANAGDSPTVLGSATQNNVQTEGAQDLFSAIKWKPEDFDPPLPSAGTVTTQPTYSPRSSEVFPDAGPQTFSSVPNNTVFAGPLGFGQQAFEFNLQPRQDGEEGAVEDTYDNFDPSDYPPLDSEPTANPSPYRFPNNTQPRNNQVVNGFNPNAHGLDLGAVSVVNADLSRPANPASYQGTSRPSLRTRKVNLNRAARKKGDPSCDPSLCYSTDVPVSEPWGNLTWCGERLFTYTHKGQWLLDRSFEAQQLREYVDNCPVDTVFWIQQTPTQCNHRLDQEDRVCRWAGCPVPNRSITAGWLRVAFDEFPALTTNGTKDPLKYSGSMHLWCFEQVFDPMEFHMSGRLRAEDRTFPNEERSVVTLEKLTDAGITRDAYQPWFNEKVESFKQHGPAKAPRSFEESLSYRLNKYHIDNQSAARQKARTKRNANKMDEERRTIDVHKGNLGLYVEITKKVKRAKKRKRLREVRSEDEGGFREDVRAHQLPTSTGSQSRGDVSRGNSSSSRGNNNNGVHAATTSATQNRPQFFNPLALTQALGATTLGPSTVPTPDQSPDGLRALKRPRLNENPDASSSRSAVHQPPLPPHTPVQNHSSSPGQGWSLHSGSRGRLQGSALPPNLNAASGNPPVYYFNPMNSAQVAVSRSATAAVQQPLQGSGQPGLTARALGKRPQYFNPLGSTLGVAQSQSQSRAQVQAAAHQTRPKAAGKVAQLITPPPQPLNGLFPPPQGSLRQDGFSDNSSSSIRSEAALSPGSVQQSSSSSSSTPPLDISNTIAPGPFPNQARDGKQNSDDAATLDGPANQGQNGNVWDASGQSYLDDFDYTMFNTDDAGGEDELNFVLGTDSNAPSNGAGGSSSSADQQTGQADGSPDMKRGQES